MSRSLRYLPRPGALVELTVRTIQRRYLLRPGPRLNQLVVGVLAHAQKATGMRLHALAVMSNHMHILASPTDIAQMAAFMCLVNANISKEIGRLHDWPGPMFGRRYSSTPVSDEPEAQIARLRYIFEQGTKENLVLAPADWPGVHTVDAICKGQPLSGIWVRRSALYEAEQRGEDVTEDDFSLPMELHLEPLPCWSHLKADVYRARVEELVQTIERETIERHCRDQTVPHGAAWVRRRHPHQRPKPSHWSPKPQFHVFARKVRDQLVAAYRAFVASYRRAAEKLAGGDVNVPFPEGAFPPRLPFVAPRKLEPG